MSAGWSLLVVAAFLICSSVSVRECRDKDEGNIVLKSCAGITRCINKVPVTTACDAGLVYDVASRQCVEEGETKNKGCDLCDGKPDGFYPDVDEDCKTYFSCAGGVSSEFETCEYFLRFNNGTGLCDNPKKIPPPCGTFVQ
jgi:hypothetical protein